MKWFIKTLLFNNKTQKSQGETPWTKGNSWLINAGLDIIFDVKQVFYRDMHAEENITAGISDILFVVTKV